jgi:hypothetical protein
MDLQEATIAPRRSFTPSATTAAAKTKRPRVDADGMMAPLPRAGPERGGPVVV